MHSCGTKVHTFVKLSFPLTGTHSISHICECGLQFYITLTKCSYLLQDGVSPLFIASQNNHKEVVQLLLAAGANPDLARLEVRSLG